MYGRYIRYGLIALAAGLPLMFNPFGANVFAPVRVALLYAGTAALSAVAALGWFYGGKVHWLRTRVNVAVAVLAIVLLMSTANSVHLFSSVVGHYPMMEGLGAWLAYLALFLLAMNAFTSGAELESLVGAVAAAGAVVAVYAVMQHVGIDPIPWGRRYDTSRVFSFSGNPAYLAAYLSLVIPATAGLSLSPGISVRARRLLFAALALMLPALFYSGGRAGWLAVFLAGSVMVFMVGRRRSDLRTFAGAAAVAVTLALLLVGVPGKTNAVSLVRSRLAGSGNRVDTIAGRWLTWKLTVPLVLEKPLLGSGLDTYYLVFPPQMSLEYERRVSHATMVDRPHNELLQMAVSSGLPGAMAYLLLLGSAAGVFVTAYRRLPAEGRPTMTGAGLGAAAYFLVLQTHFSTVDISPTFWVLLGAAVGVSVRELGGPGREQEKPDRELIISARLKDSWLGQGLATGMALGFVVAVTVTSARPVLADIYFQRALASESAGRRGDTLTQLSRAVEVEPGNDFYVNQLGQTYLTGIDRKNGMSGLRGIGLLNRARAMNPLHEYYYLDLGRANLALFRASRQGRYLMDARRALERVKAMDPYFHEIRVELGRAYGLMGDKRRAAIEASAAAGMRSVGR